MWPSSREEARSTVVYRHADSSVEAIEAEPGTNLMRVAVQSGVRGITGECGGQAMCATCHVHVREGYLDQLGPIDEDEEEMLDCTVAPRLERSRLGCQVVVGSGLPEIQADVPQTQL